MSWRTLAEWAGFQAVWFACALGAAHGANWPGAVAAALFLSTVLAGRGWARPELVSVLASGVLGGLAESGLAASGLVVYGASVPSAAMAPLWIVALWLAFGATLPGLDALFGDLTSTKATLMAASVGAVSGPLAYLAGARLGALQLTGNAWPALLALALVWALALPLLLRLRRRLLQ